MLRKVILSPIGWQATPEGLAILQDQDCQLARLINENGMNHVIEQGPNKGESVAYVVGKSI